MARPMQRDVPPDPTLQRFDRLRRYFRVGRAPWVRSGGRIGFLTIAPAQSDLDHVVSRRAFGEALRARFATELQNEATLGLALCSPVESARAIGDRTGPSLVVLLMAVSAFAVARPDLLFSLLALFATTLFAALAAARLFLAALAQAPARRRPRARLTDHELPVVTILAPLFREAHALPGLARAIRDLDYPPSKIDVKLLLEEGDAETRAEALRLGLDRLCDIIVVPASHPQTKPKACNYGLACARGDLVVIYDAEDEPEAAQLRIAAETFAWAGGDLACVQARLNFYNPEETWLTRLFTIEYCLWFDHFLPALDRIGAPVPLGGTSNIFRTEVLAEVGGWDPYNVTEDADLGLRLARRGFRTAVIDSTTFEEANCRTGNWMRQRTRWMKGYLQTWLVHRRDMKFSGWRGVLAVDLFVGGTAFAALLNPLMWAMVAVDAFGGPSPAQGLPDSVEAALIGALAIGNAAFLGLGALAPGRRGLWRLAPFALLIPFYWLMMSAAAWRALLQLVTRPSWWEKTDHGLSLEAKARRAAALRSWGLE